MEQDFLICPICQLRPELHDLERHVNSHLDEADCAKDRALARELASTSHSSLQDIECWKNSLVTCTECCEKVSIEYWASHCLMHELQADDYSKSCQRNSKETDDKDMDRIHFSKKQKVEPCVFDKGSSWSTVEVIDGMDRQAFLSTQRKGVFRLVAEGINNLLRNCLEFENQKVSCTAISGHIDHFESCASEDSGWGCGWRNIQMMSSHLLTQNWGANEALFGGVGFVPDIPSLQHWLELAWACGFDRTGAEFYHDKIHGSKEWIGATECAALFRSFGLRARVVDFSSAGDRMKKGGQSSIERWLHGHSAKRIQRQTPEVHKALENSAIHHDVECDMCGAYPIRGIRFKSRKRIDYDVCSACLYSSEENPDEYEKIETFSRVNVGFKGKEVARDEDVNHESLVNWVWDYFTGGTKDSSVRACMDQLHGQVVTSCCTPLYFQHQGHSRTIVGMQRRRKYSGAKEEVFLLVLDPSCKTEELVRSLRYRGQWQRLIKRGVHTLKKASYQVCYIEPGIAHGEELEQLKVLTSEHFFY